MELHEISERLGQIAVRIKAQIPENADPMTDRVLEGYNRTGGAAAEASRAARALEART